jgi:hypothetical protein
MRVWFPLGRSVGSDARALSLAESCARDLRSQVPVGSLPSDCPAVCPMRHEGNGHATRAGSDALSEYGRGLALLWSGRRSDYPTRHRRPRVKSQGVV